MGKTNDVEIRLQKRRQAYSKTLSLVRRAKNELTMPEFSDILEEVEYDDICKHLDTACFIIESEMKKIRGNWE